jgi:hypothetical protein
MTDLPNDFIGVRKLKIFLTYDVWTDLEHLFESISFCEKTHLPIFTKTLDVFGISAKTYLLELDHQDFRTHSSWSTKYGIPFGSIFENVGVKVGVIS